MDLDREMKLVNWIVKLSVAILTVLVICVAFCSCCPKVIPPVVIAGGSKTDTVVKIQIVHDSIYFEKTPKSIDSGKTEFIDTSFQTPHEKINLHYGRDNKTKKVNISIATQDTDTTQYITSTTTTNIIKSNAAEAKEKRNWTGYYIGGGFLLALLIVGGVMWFLRRKV